MKNKGVHMITFLLVMIGALNWGLMGAFGFNLVTYLLGSWPMVERVVYILVGVSAIVEIAMHPSMCSCCMKDGKMD